MPKAVQEAIGVGYLSLVLLVARNSLQDLDAAAPSKSKRDWLLLVELLKYYWLLLFYAKDHVIP